MSGSGFAAALARSCALAAFVITTTQQGHAAGALAIGACAAYAIDGRNACGPHGYATAPTLARAQNVALRNCYQDGGRDCVVRAFACDGAD